MCVKMTMRRLIIGDSNIKGGYLIKGVLRKQTFHHNIEMQINTERVEKLQMNSNERYCTLSRYVDFLKLK